MQYQPSRDQRALAEALDEALNSILPVTRLHHEPWESEAVWAELDAIGVFGLSLAEAQGGSGLGPVEDVLVAMALGRRLASPAVFARMGAVHARPSHGPYDGSGDGPVAVAFPVEAGWSIVSDPRARRVLARGPQAASLHALDDLAEPVADNPWLDALTRRPAFDAPLATFDAAGLLRLRLLDAAALAGLAEAVLRAAVDYAGVREQFGRPIGSFQAVKHHCANMAVSAREAADLTTFAAAAVDQGRPDAVFLVDSALVMATSAALSGAAKNIQIHGAIGFSDEAEAHLFLKRARMLAAISGGPEQALERLGDIRREASVISDDAAHDLAQREYRSALPAG